MPTVLPPIYGIGIDDDCMELNNWGGFPRGIGCVVMMFRLFAGIPGARGAPAIPPMLVTRADGTPVGFVPMIVEPWVLL